MRYIIWSIFQNIANWLKDGDADYDASKYKKFKNIEALHELNSEYLQKINRANDAPSHDFSGLSLSHSGLGNDKEFLLSYYKNAPHYLKRLANQVDAVFNKNKGEVE